MHARRAALAASLAALVLLAGCTSLVRQGQANNDWALDLIGVPALHARGLTGQGIIVAIVDTGIDASHPDFEGVTVRWSDHVNGRSQPYDDAGHGTHVSGLVVAQARAGGFDPRVLGVAPGADLLHIKGVPGSGTGSGADIARAVDQATDGGAHVLILSLGGGRGLPIIGRQVEDAVQRAIDRGVVVVAAAGNADTSAGQTGNDCTVVSPAIVPGVIAVGAVDRSARIADFSCKGDNAGTDPLGLTAPQDPDKKPELVAPGVELIGPWPERDCAGVVSTYCLLSGTSQAAPLVGGIAALLLEAHPELKRKDAASVRTVKEALVEGAERVPGQSGAHDDRYGYGLVRGDRALARLA